MRELSPTLMSEQPYSPEKSKSNTLLECVYKNDKSGVMLALQNNVMAWNTKNEYGTTPLMEASILNRVEILEVLLSFKCDVNATDVDGNTALHLAVDEGNTDIVRKLVESGRCIADAANEKGETALMKACFYDYTDMVRTLLKDGNANPDVRDKDGQTALMIALKEGSHNAVDLLLKHGCDFSVTDNLGHSALYFAINSSCNKTLDLAKKLVSAGYYNDSDRTWILNEEKHNLFYQDDEFYADLRKRLRSFSSDTGVTRKTSVESNASSRSSSRSPVLSPKHVSPTSPPFAMSPRLKQKIMSPEHIKFPAFNFSKIAQEERNHSSSPAPNRRAEYTKAASFEQMQPRTALRRPLTSSFSSDSDESPSVSPLLRQRNTQNAVKSSNVSLIVRDVAHDQRKQEKVANVTQSNLVTSSLPTQSEQETRTKGTQSYSVTEGSMVHIKQEPVTRTATIKSEEVISSSAPNSPVINYRRQASALIPRAGSDESVHQRKTSLPSKPTVQFSTQIHVIEYSSRL